MIECRAPIVVDTREWSATYASVIAAGGGGQFSAPLGARTMPTDPSVALIRASLPAPVEWSLTIVAVNPSWPAPGSWIVEIGAGGGGRRFKMWLQNQPQTAKFVGQTVAVYRGAADPQNPLPPPQNPLAPPQNPLAPLPWPDDASVTLALAPTVWPWWAVPASVERWER